MSNVTAGSIAVALGLSLSIMGVIVTLLSLTGARLFLTIERLFPKHSSQVNHNNSEHYSRWISFALLAACVIAVAVMEHALITRDFTMKFVADNGSSATPPLFNVATLWSALEGSILLWALVLCIYIYCCCN